MACVKGKSGSGGRRSGAGRPRKDQLYADVIDNAHEAIAKDIPNAVQRQIAFALAGDRQANEYLLNRIMGKPTERVEHDIDDEIAGVLSQLAAFRQEETT